MYNLNSKDILNCCQSNISEFETIHLMPFKFFVTIMQILGYMSIALILIQYSPFHETIVEKYSCKILENFQKI
jgi:hypothetical protein